jgi:hypothetical protein
MNLLWSVNEEDLAYPVGIFEQNPEKWKPRVLAIADSYYFNIYYSNIPDNVFANKDFWYFGKRVFPSSYQKETTIADINAKEVINSQDIILCMVTGRFMHRAFWGKINMMYQIYNENAFHDPLIDIYDEITGYDNWFQKIYSESKVKKMPFHELLANHAKYTVSEQNKQNPKQEILSLSKDEWIEHYKKLIRSSDEWLKQIENKAKEQNISIEEMINRDATWCYNEDYKNGKIQVSLSSDEKEKEISKIIDEIRSSPEWLKQIEKKAKENNKTLDEMIREDAVWLLNQRQKQATE